MTHFATADEADDGGFFEAQLDAFARWAHEIKERQPQMIAHAANSAAVLRDSRSHFDLVRCGIAVYGMDPFGEDAAARGLEPALELLSYVAEVKRLRAGQSAGYGRRFVAHADAHLGVLPIGYGDGWRRGLSNNADVLIAGRRYPLVGTVSMDNVTVLLGAEREAQSLRGEPAVLIGEQGRERISAEEVARRLDTINYEVTCALSARVPRAYHRDGAHLAGPSTGGADETAAAAGAERG
jgi:alanine racemase